LIKKHCLQPYVQAAQALLLKQHSSQGALRVCAALISVLCTVDISELF